MKRLEVVGKSFTFTDDVDPQYKSLSFQVQVLRGQHNYVRAEFFLEGQELANFLAGDRDYEKLAEEKMRWILELHQTPVDAYMLESMQKETQAVKDQLSEQLAQKDIEISTLQQMIVELTLMLSMIGQQELPTEPDPETPVDPEPPADPEPAPTEPIPEEPTDEEPNPEIPTENSDPIGGEGGE